MLACLVLTELLGESVLQRLLTKKEVNVSLLVITLSLVGWGPDLFLVTETIMPARNSLFNSLPSSPGRQRHLPGQLALNRQCASLNKTCTHRSASV